MNRENPFLAAGSTISLILALFAIGMVFWIFRYYLRVTKFLIRAGSFKIGLLPGHVVSASLWSICMLIRAIARDQFELRPPPLYLAWPATMFFCLWLIFSLYLIVKHYRETSRSNGPRQALREVKAQLEELEDGKRDRREGDSVAGDKTQE